MSLREAVKTVGVEDAEFYSYLVIRECKCGEFEEISCVDLLHNDIDMDLPVTRIDEDNWHFIYVEENYVCEECSSVYEFPESLSEHKTFTEFVCDLLDIDVPKVFISEVIGGFRTLGSCQDENTIIIYPRLLNRTSDCIKETIVHELRHVWQHKNNTEFDTSMEYDKRPHEVDAYTFTSHFFSNINDLFRLVAQGFNPILEKEQLKESIRDFGFKGCM